MTTVRRITGATFRSLNIRNYRLFFSGQVVSLVGTWMQTVAQDWLVLRLSHSGLAVGITTGLQFLPMLLFGLWGGLVADRLDKRKVLIATQAAAGVLAMVLGVLTATGVVQLWMVFVLAFLLGCVTVVDQPTRQAFVTEMVGPDEVANAVGLNSAIFNSARVVGPAVAGVLIQTVGLAPAFFVNGASFLAVIAGLRAMDPTLLVRLERAPRSKGQLRDGLRYVWGTPELRTTILIVAFVGTFALNFNVILPLMARFTFHGGAGLYGLLSSMMGIGALGGALAAAARGRPTARLMEGTAILFGVGTLLAAMAPTVPLELAALVPAGAGAIGFVATANSTLQLRSTPIMRGRVMAVYALVFLGSTPIGGPLMGWISQQWSPRVAFGISGAFALVTGVVAVLVRQSSARLEPVPELLQAPNAA
jgi:MFS family permease